jgi:hypothetical protein
MALTAEQQKMVADMQASENARMGARFKDFGTGVLKANTSDILNTIETAAKANNPVLGLIANALKKSNGVSASLGDTVLEKTTGLKPNESSEMAAGELVSFGGAGKAVAGTLAKAMIIPALPKLYKEVLTMSAAGASKAETFNALGGYKDLDKHVKTILSDAGASINDAGLAKLQAGKTVTAEELVSHPELFKVLPQLKGMLIDAFPPGDKRLGSMTGSKDMALNLDQTDKGILSTFLHESQHAIQSLFGWAKGANVQMHLPNDMPARKQAIIDLHAAGKNEEARKLQTEYNNLQTEARRRYENSRGEQEARFTQMAMDLDLNNLGAKVLSILKRGDTPQTSDTKLLRDLPTKP